YYEEYTVPQMATLLKRNINTIYSRLHRAKKLIKSKLEAKEYEFSF
ncbi:MAG TPA: sigma factor-like helix-turn-helix DNA-binding protein, partial [Desulfitobacteriaceae bacterium]|nr:sigma factor-like helix-turn-helix DNA-binding protein [Desulfitobacteriaceae bacterium]